MEGTSLPGLAIGDLLKEGRPELGCKIIKGREQKGIGGPGRDPEGMVSGVHMWAR